MRVHRVHLVTPIILSLNDEEEVKVSGGGGEGVIIIIAILSSQFISVPCHDRLFVFLWLNLVPQPERLEAGFRSILWTIGFSVRIHQL